ncbi:hypothetical protein [Actinomycetospora succinea]|uniref:hypothetical protein n=1 Tax=Actinomycetospora succinea TaxID=663603 RepID=UPI00105ED796
MATSPVVGRVLAVEPIDGAEQVRSARVDAGTRTLQVVFGGPPVVQVGSLVPVAPPGTRVARCGKAVSVKMRTRRYRGTLSEGMLCSLAELGWVHEGPDEVAVLKKGVAGQVLPYEGELAEWLSELSYQRHIEFFLPLGGNVLPLITNEPISPPTAPLSAAELRAACHPRRRGLRSLVG